MDVSNTEHLVAEYARNTIVPSRSNTHRVNRYQNIDTQIKNLVIRALSDSGYESEQQPGTGQWQVSIWNTCEHHYDGANDRLVCDKDSAFPVVIVHPSNCTAISDSADSSKPLLSVGLSQEPSAQPTTPQPAILGTSSFGRVSVSKVERRALCGAQELHLTPKEFELLWLFVNQPRRVFTRQELVNRVWGVNFEGYEHTVSNHINRLRKKLAHGSDSNVSIETVWGIGYKITEITL